MLRNASKIDDSTVLGSAKTGISNDTSIRRSSISSREKFNDPRLAYACRRMLARGRKNDSSTSSLPCTFDFRYIHNTSRAVHTYTRTWNISNYTNCTLWRYLKGRSSGNLSSHFMPATQLRIFITRSYFEKKSLFFSDFSTPLLFIAAVIIINLLEQRCSSLAWDEKASISADLRMINGRIAAFTRDIRIL